MDETLSFPGSIETGEMVYQDRNQTISRIAERRVWIPLPRCIAMGFGQKIVGSLSIITPLAYHALGTRQGRPIELVPDP